jgi:hypothetical protein
MNVCHKLNVTTEWHLILPLIRHFLIMEYSLTDRFSRGSIVGSTDLMVLQRPIETTRLTGS